MKDNNTTPAMKEVESEDIRKVALMAAKIQDEKLPFETSRPMDNFINGFFIGAQYREENPVNPVAKEGKSIDQVIDETMTFVNCQKFSRASVKRIVEAYAAQLTEVKGEEWQGYSDQHSLKVGETSFNKVQYGWVEIITKNESCCLSAEEIAAFNKFTAAPSTHSSSETPTPKQDKEWVRVCDLMPPFDKPILLRGVMSWRSKDKATYFSDIVKNDYEILEYGYSGYLLENNSDFLVVNHHNPEEVCSEYITHWKYINEPEA